MPSNRIWIGLLSRRVLRLLTTDPQTAEEVYKVYLPRFPRGKVAQKFIRAKSLGEIEIALGRLLLKGLARNPEVEGVKDTTRYLLSDDGQNFLRKTK